MSRNTARTLIAALASLVIACGGSSESMLTDPELPSSSTGSLRKKGGNGGGGGGKPGGGGGVNVEFTGNIVGAGTVKGNRNGASSNSFTVTFSTDFAPTDPPDETWTAGKVNYCYNSVNQGNPDGANHLLTLGSGSLTGELDYSLDAAADHASFSFHFDIDGLRYRLHAGVGTSVPNAVVDVVDDGETTTVTVSGGRFSVTKPAGKGKKGAPGGTVACLPVNFSFTATG